MHLDQVKYPISQRLFQLEPAWETIVENVLVYNMLQVAGTSTGEAFVLGNEYNLSDSKMYTILLEIQ